MNVVEEQSASSLGAAAGSSADAGPACGWKPHAAWWLKAAARGLDAGRQRLGASALVTHLPCHVMGREVEACRQEQQGCCLSETTEAQLIGRHGPPVGPQAALAATCAALACVYCE